MKEGGEGGSGQLAIHGLQGGGGGSNKKNVPYEWSLTHQQYIVAIMAVPTLDCPHRSTSKHNLVRPGSYTVQLVLFARIMICDFVIPKSNRIN